MTVVVRGDAAAGTQWFDSPRAELVPRQTVDTWVVDVYPKGEGGARLLGRDRRFILSHHGVAAATPEAAAQAALHLAGLERSSARN